MQLISVCSFAQNFLGIGYWVLGTESRVLANFAVILLRKVSVPGYWVLGIGYWVLGIDIFCIDGIKINCTRGEIGALKNVIMLISICGLEFGKKSINKMAIREGFV